MATIGYRKIGVSTVLLFGPTPPTASIAAMMLPEGSPVACYEDPEAWGDWPDPASLVDVDNLWPYSMYMTVEDGLVVSSRACLWWLSGPFGTFETKSTKMALYDTSFNLLGSTNTVSGIGDFQGWKDYTFAPAVALEEGTPCVLAVWGTINGPWSSLYLFKETEGGWDADYWDPVPLGGVTISGVSDVLAFEETLSGYGPGFAASDVLVLGEALGNYGPGFAASDVLAFEENLRHGGVIAPCDGRFIPPEPEEYCTNPHRWNG